jgi:type I restriction enzyme M protein
MLTCARIGQGAGDLRGSGRIIEGKNFVWQIAETLRGDFKQSEYGKVILPFVVLRRLDCILEPTKDAVLKAHARLPPGIDQQTRDMMLYGAVGGGIRVYNTSPLTFAKIRAQNPSDVHNNVIAYIRTSRTRLGMSSSTSSSSRTN